MIDAPHSPLPWTQPRENGPIYDRDGKLVAGVENLHYLADVALQHPVLRDKLRELTDAFELAASLAGFPEQDIKALAGSARALVRKATVAP